MRFSSAVAASVFGLCAVSGAAAQNEVTAPSIATVVATVNGTDITLGQLILSRNSLPSEYQQLPDAALFDGLLEQLIQQEMLAQSLSDDPPSTLQPTIDNELRTLRASAAIEEFVAELDLEAEVAELYAQRFANAEPEPEYNASHILLETEEEALNIIALLENGQEFASLAEQFSTGPSGPSGGQLGWFGTGRMVAEFEAAVVALNVGEVSAPVHTDFGWHVIVLNDTRMRGAPSFEEVQGMLEGEAQRIAVDRHVEMLQEAAEITRSVEGIDPSVMSQFELFE